MARSAACGAWIDFDGKHAHRFCEGKVNLPAPENVCDCCCHGSDEHRKVTDGMCEDCGRQPAKL